MGFLCWAIGMIFGTYILEICTAKIIVPSTCSMPPKRKPVSKAVTKPRKLSEADSPLPTSRSDEEKPMTPLLERIRRKSGEGKQLDMNMSAASSVEHGESPAWKKQKASEGLVPENEENAVSVNV